MLQEQALFYKMLYTLDPDINFVFCNQGNPVLSPMQKADSARKITIEELTIALKSLKPQGAGPLTVQGN